jgi:hypothetical protein
MQTSREIVEQEEYRVAIVLPLTRMVLARGYRDSYLLPRLSIPKWTRTAEQITRAIRKEWNVVSITIDFLPSEAERPVCVVAELLNSHGNSSPANLIPMDLDAIDVHELTRDEREDLRTIFERNTGSPLPFSRLGWIAEAQQWIRTNVRDRSVEFNDDIRQLNAGASSTLVRFGTEEGPAYWLKANGETNQHEFTITTTLSKYFPEYLPPLVAWRKDWNAWVTEDAGISLGEADDLLAFSQAIHCLANLQKSSVSKIGALFANGCADQRLHVLLAHVPALIGYLEEAMAAQISTKVEPIATPRLRALQALLEAGLVELDRIGVPDTLIHNDANFENILFDGTRAVFTDWAEGYIGHPLMTFQHLRIQVEHRDATRTWAPLLTAIYKEHWWAILSEAKVERAFALIPPLAIASHLCGRDMSFTALYRKDLQGQSYARSLARHMDRAAQVPAFLDTLCS